MARFCSEGLEGVAALLASTVEESDIDATGDGGVDHNCAGCFGGGGLGQRRVVDLLSKPRGFVKWDGFRVAVGAELAGRMLLEFATGDQLLIFDRHHLVRELMLDRTRSYQRLLQPRRRDSNRDQLQLELQTHPLGRAALGAGPALHVPLPRGAAEVPESRAANGRQPLIASATVESGEAAALHSARRHPTTNQLSPMS